MNVKRILLGLAVVSLSLGVAFTGFADEPASKMDCEAMFQKAERMLSEDTALSTEQKARKYAMAARAYEKCIRAHKDMKEAEDYFKKVFDSSGKM